MARSPGPALQYRLIGGLTVLRDGQPVDLGGRKQRAVLATLLVHVGRVVPVDRLIDHVWGDAAPGRAEVSLQAYVSKLRRLLEPDHPPGQAFSVLVTDAGGYRLVADRGDVDLTRFDDLRAAAAVALAAGDIAGAAAQFDAALALAGALLPELADEPWVAEAAARLDAGRADALDGAFEAKLALGDGRSLIPGLEAAVAAHPFRERLRGHLALALYRAGRQTDALRSLADARRTLADEIGVEPGPELRQLEADILAHAPRLTAPTSPAGTGPQPPRAGDQVGLVGRDDELAGLVESARLAAGGSGRAVVISGEPGIGKTRLVEELARAAGDDVVVCWARCPESAASAPYWALEQFADQLVAAGVITEDERAGTLADAKVHPTDPGADRLTFHSSAARALRSVTRPLLLVVDDLQWADPSSLRMIEFLAGELRTMPVLLVVTVRPLGPEPPAPLVACLGELARQAGSRRVDLVGLTEADVAVWGRRRTDTTVPDEVTRFVHERTSGNPFFVGEVVELLARQDHLADIAATRAVGVPAAAHDVVRRRVSLLPSEAQQLLATASVLGVAIDVDVLAHVAALPVGTALDVLDPAVEAGLLSEDRTAPGRLRFAHALVTDALAAELSFSRRARLHAAVVDAIEALRSASIDDQLPALVHHAREGALAGTAQRAFDYAVRAARSAADGVAFEAAAAYWDDALQVLDLARPGNGQARYDVLVELGAAQLRADDLGGSQDALLEAIGVAEALGDAEAVRRAATALAASTFWQTSPYGEVNARMIAALERVLADLPDDATPERASLVGALADAVYYERDPARSLSLSAESMAIARRTGDAPTLALALNQRFRAIWRNTSAAEQRLLADEMVELADAGLVGPEFVVLARLARAITAFTHADLATFETDLARGQALAEQSQLPGLLSQVGWAEAAWLLALGRYDEAAERARGTHLIYRRTRGWDADDILASFEVAIAHDRGTLVEVLDATVTLIDGKFGSAARELVAWMLTERGLHDRARALVGPEGSVPDPPPDWLWFEATTAAAHARAGLGDRAACAILYDRLSPFPGRLDLAAGPFLGGIDFALARTAEAIGDHAAARRHAAAAVEVLERLGTRPALARALLTHGCLLAGADSEADRASAPAVLDRARDLANELGLVPVVAALDAIQAGSKPHDA